jgi:chromosome segregation ATPase
LEQKHNEAIAAQALDHAGKFQEAVKAAEAIKVELDSKVKKLEDELATNGKEVSALKADAEKVIHTLADLQTSLSTKAKELTAAHDSIADLKLKLTTLEESLEAGKERERELLVNWEKEKTAHANAKDAFGEHKKVLQLWTDRLVDVAERLAAQMIIMDKQSYSFTIDNHESTSAKLTLFFESILEALKKHHEERSAQFTSESCKLCEDVLSKVLVKIAYQNPDVDLSKAFKSLPKGVDTKAAKELVAPLVSKVSQILRTEGQRKD